MLERLIAAYGWRTAWAIEGLAVWAVVLPVAVLGIRDRPAQLGQQADGRTRPGQHADIEWGVTRAAAMRSPFFWVVTAGVALAALLTTAIGFHQISLLGERGLSPGQAAANFLPQMGAALAATLGTGVLVDRFSPRLLIATSMLALAAGAAWATMVAPGWSAIGFAITIGSAGGSIRCLEAATFPRSFGTLHLGAIRGLVFATTVGGERVRADAFALLHDASGSYTGALLSSATLPLIVAVAAAIVRAPHPPGHHLGR